MRNSSRDWRWLRETSSTLVHGTNSASASPSIATTVDFPACRQQHSSSLVCLDSSTSTCQASGSRPSRRMTRTPGGLGRGVCSLIGFTVSSPREKNPAPQPPPRSGEGGPEPLPPAHSPKRRGGARNAGPFSGVEVQARPLPPPSPFRGGGLGGRGLHSLSSGLLGG